MIQRYGLWSRMKRALTALLETNREDYHQFQKELNCGGVVLVIFPTRDEAVVESFHWLHQLVRQVLEQEKELHEQIKKTDDG